MDDAVRVREAAREALSDIEPPTLHETLVKRFVDASMTPGVLALMSARALDPGSAAEDVVERAAGVQLIYEGLRLTRQLGHDEPWAQVADLEDDIAADMEILAADVLVSRGFYLLARTEAATRAVETVRSFGRDQTLRRAAVDEERTALDRNLEVDVFELAVVAGATGVGFEPPDALLEYAASLVREYDGDLPPSPALLPDATAEHIASLSADGGEDRVPSSATDR